MVAEVITRSFRDADVKARIGGDEFAVLAHLADGLAVDTILERLAWTLQSRNRSNGAPRPVSFSVGTCSVEAGDPPALDDMLAMADVDLYRDKRKARSERAATV